MTLKWSEVYSSHVTRVGYDETTQELHVVFHDGSEWAYPGVEKGVFNSLLNTASVGRYMSRVIKPVYGSGAYKVS